MSRVLVAIAIVVMVLGAVSAAGATGHCTPGATINNMGQPVSFMTCSLAVWAPGRFEVEVHYSHEQPQGETYWTVSSADVLFPSTGTALLHAEGFPDLMLLRKDGRIVDMCVCNATIFNDGLEAGDTSAWKEGPRP